MKGRIMMKGTFLTVMLVFAAGSILADGGIGERVFRERRLTRGNTNLALIQPIDEASWIWNGSSRSSSAEILVFRKSFDVKADDQPLVFDVSADERFYLTCDGKFVARGPNRADIENWQYQTYRLTLAPGQHEIRAVVTRLGDHAPLAQLSYRGGFILKAEGAFDARLTTGKAKWQVARFDGLKPIGADNGVWGTGSQFEIVGSGPFAVSPTDWRDAVVVRAHAAKLPTSNYGGRSRGWMLFPSQLPDQTETLVRPGTIRAATHGAAWRTHHVYTEAETKTAEVADFNGLLHGGRVTVPANTRLQLAWHLGKYYCAYPQLVVAGGKNARVSWTWTESSRNSSNDRKDQRDAIVGKYLEGYGDVFVSDGNGGTFSAPWFRCGLWCRLDVETKDEPLEIRDLALIESRYPLEMESDFTSLDDPSLTDIRRICTRAMQMCCHEMLFDCPYYEQQMYPGDSRVQLLALSALSRDERMIKRVIELYELATRDDGQCPFNWPTRGTQEGFTYTLCYLCMYGDYVMNHADRAWLRARLPGLRKAMAGCELYENADGLIENTPGWNFMDWAVGWAVNGLIPNCNNGSGCNAFANLFWLMAMQSAATTERVLGNDLQAQYWQTKAAKLKAKIIDTFWVAQRGLLADIPVGQTQPTFSEHVQSLALLTDALPADQRELCFAHLIADKDLIRTTVYFDYYLFETYFKFGRADLFQKRLDLWRDYVKKGITTLSERPDVPKEGRSDCHAWGAHPLWFMQTGLAGIRSDAPFFAMVRVAPQPGTLKSLKARHPHPQGMIEVDLAFDGNAAKGVVITPVPGTFVYGGRTLALAAGTNDISSLSPVVAWPTLKSYEGEFLRRVKMPMGGIGTGTISLAGRGALVDWELHSRPDKGYTPSSKVASCFLLRTESAEGKVTSRLLEGPIDSEFYEAAEGSRAVNDGFPRFAACKFNAAYPLAQVELRDGEVPLAATLEAMNPLVPGDAEASGVPAVMLRWVLKNETDKPIKASVCAVMANPCGGAVKRTTFESGSLSGISFASPDLTVTQDTVGEFACAVDKSVGSVTHCTRIPDEGWMVGFDTFWREFAAKGQVRELADEKANCRPLSAVSVELTVAAKGEVKVPFVIGWRFPHRCSWTPSKPPSNGAFGSEDDVGNYYATRFASAKAAIDALWSHRAEWEAKTVEFVKSVVEAKAPAVIREAALFNLSTFRTETCFRTADGHFFGWEGTRDKAGSCFGSCSHVWGYEHALIDLWPSLAKDMTELQYGPASDDRGRMSFRIGLPLARSARPTIDAADGHLQCAIKAYENWRKTGDDAWMKGLYPRIRKSMEFCWVEGGWDADCDGVMEGCQHNTMDVEYYGPNPQMGFLYLAALKAVEKMAEKVGDGAFAEKCRALAEHGGKWMEANLFNGEYYEHRVQPPRGKIADGISYGSAHNLADPDYQLAAGCLIDQLLGDYAARAVGLGPIADETHARASLDAVLRHNRANDRSAYNPMRVYAFPGERSLTMSWYPAGRMPAKPFPYYRETMTGFEYVVAAALAQRGDFAAAEQVVRDIRSRYDGKKRNPFDEAECGHHYARALVAWSVLKAWKDHR